MNKNTAALALPLAGFALVVGFFAPWVANVSAWDMFFLTTKASLSFETSFLMAALAAIPAAGALFGSTLMSRSNWQAGAGVALLGYSALYGIHLAARAAWAVSSWGVLLVVLAGTLGLVAAISRASSR